MRAFATMAAAATVGLASGAAEAQSLASPHVFTCGSYLAAQQSDKRGEANVMLYWATGYLQARLGPLPTTNFTAESFESDLREVHGVLLQICPNIPDMKIATFMDNFAGDFEKTARPKTE